MKPNGEDSNEVYEESKTGYWTYDLDDIEERVGRIFLVQPTAENRKFEQFMVILIGLPGSGKTTFARSLEKAMPWKFARVNQDELGKRKACEKKTREALKAGLCPVIDRCNFDFCQRKHFLKIAEDYNVPVKCVSFDFPTKECIRRCRLRPNHESVKPEEANTIVAYIKKKFVPPHRLEGIVSVSEVSDTNMFDDVFLTILNIGHNIDEYGHILEI